MSKKAYIISAGCFILGIIIGAGVTLSYSGKIGAEGMFLTRAAALSRSYNQATDAYQHESTQVAIYASSQYLATLDADEQLGENLLMPTFSLEMAVTHGRLAELYKESEQSDAIAQQVSEALKYAKDSGALWVTNETMLAKFVARSGTRKVTQ